MRVTHVLAVVGLLVLASALSFLVGVSGSADRHPVSFGDTIHTGLTGVDVRQAKAAGHEIPKAEVFYSQYRYVVGYYGIQSAARAVSTEGPAGQFGRPLAVFVTDYAGADPAVGPDGYLTVATDPQVGWVPASEATFVVDSGARTPGGAAVVPFDDRAAAEEFAAETGGRTVDWARIGELAAAGRESPLATGREARAERSAWADRQAARAAGLRDRPVSVVVGEDAPTLSSAVAAAPPNTTVRVPPGRYDANLTVDRPVTIRGAGPATVLDGGGNGTAVRVTAPGAALTSLGVEGAGDRIRGEYNGTTDRWDGRVRQVYGGGDAAVRVEDAPGVVLSDLSVSSTATGVLVIDSDGVVVRDLSFEGTDVWQEGFMGVLSIGSRLLVADSTFHGGRDGVYLHDADGTVVRDSGMTDLRYGVHWMYTSRTLVANTDVSDASIGLVVMTRPAGNVLADNRVRDADVGVSVSGSGSFVLGNDVRSTGRGIDLGTQRSVYARNTVVDNRVGLRTGTILPTNDVFANDVVGNDRPAATGRGPVRTWGYDGRGNYWGPLPGRDADGDGVIDRPFRPTGPLDSRVQDSPATVTLAASPAVAALRAFQERVPGLRRADVVDPVPLTDPVRPGRLNASDATGVSP